MSEFETQPIIYIANDPEALNAMLGLEVPAAEGESAGAVQPSQWEKLSMDDEGYTGIDPDGAVANIALGLHEDLLTVTQELNELEETFEGIKMDTDQKQEIVDRQLKIQAKINFFKSIHHSMRAQSTMSERVIDTVCDIKIKSLAKYTGLSEDDKLDYAVIVTNAREAFMQDLL